MSTCTGSDPIKSEAQFLEFVRGLPNWGTVKAVNDKFWAVMLPVPWQETLPRFPSVCKSVYGASDDLIHDQKDLHPVLRRFIGARHDFFKPPSPSGAHISIVPESAAEGSRVYFKVTGIRSFIPTRGYKEPAMFDDSKITGRWFVLNVEFVQHTNAAGEADSVVPGTKFHPHISLANAGLVDCTHPRCGHVRDVVVFERDGIPIYSISLELPYIPAMTPFEAKIEHRYSSLLLFHEKLVGELGEDPSAGLFPPKKLLRGHTLSTAETRRDALFDYFHALVSDQRVLDSEAFSTCWSPELPNKRRTGSSAEPLDLGPSPAALLSPRASSTSSSSSSAAAVGAAAADSPRATSSRVTPGSAPPLPSTPGATPQ